MKITRLRAVQMFNALGRLDKRMDGSPYDIDFDEFILAWRMMEILRTEIEPFQKAREARMKVIAAGTPLKRDQFGQQVIDDPDKQGRFLDEEAELLDATIRLRFPKRKLNLATDRNKYPPGMLMELRGAWQEPDPNKFPLEDDDSDDLGVSKEAA
jgi:hypothetical protein